MSLGVTAKFVLLTVGLIGISSVGFTALHLRLTQAEVESDLRRRAVIFAHEIAATISDRREFENRALLEGQTLRIIEARPSVLQIDILAFHEPRGTRLVASSHPQTRLPFPRADADEVRAGRTVSRLIGAGTDRYWEVLAPIRLDGGLVGAIGVKFSSATADRLAANIRWWALVFTTALVLVTAVITAIAARLAVGRPVQRLLDAVDRVRRGAPDARVEVAGNDELAVLARHFNEMLEQVERLHGQLQRRVADATAQLDRRLSEVSRLNEQLFQIQGRLRHAERLALAGRFMAQVAHEIGTPLHSVAGHLELLRRELPSAVLGGEPGRRLAIVEGQLGRVSEIISQLLDTTRAAPAARERVALDDLVAQTIELIRPGVSARGIELVLDAGPGRPEVEARGTQLQQVLLNLLMNAVDATPAGGRIEVRIRRPIPDRAEIEVEDTGRGIAPEALPSLFEPFFTTKEPGRGTGLGLFIAAEVVREHGGEISVKSQEGAGTTFLVALPAAGPEEA